MSSFRLGYPIIKIQISYEQDIVLARQKTRRLAELLGFDGQDQSRMATSVSELARNVYQYAKTGSIEFFFNETMPQTLFIKVSDQGPGIAHLKEILNGVYVSKSGMGVGLLGSRKLMDFFEIETTPGKGTQVYIGQNLDNRAKPIKKEELPLLAMQLSNKDLSSPLEELKNHNQELLATLEDLSKSRSELKELNSELEETNKGVLALYAELDEKAESLKKANDVKTKFLSNMTHEFRTPLSSIISLTRLLLNRVDGELSSEQEKQVNYIRKSGETLLELVNDLLDLAKVEAGRISINATEFHVEELLTGLRGMFRPIVSENAAVTFSVSWDDNIKNMQTDQAKVSQILRNLISNSIKFTEKGFVQVSASSGKNDSIHFKVSDSGIGILQEHHNAVFEDFSQVDSKIQKKHKGTGLGLPLSKKFARLLGGNLWVESKIGEGSTFHVVIPRVYAGETERAFISAEPDASSAAQIGKPSIYSETENRSEFKVLLVDDDEPSRYVLKDLVKSQLSASFIEASDGESGIKRIKQDKPDLVFLDLNMPGLDGFGFLEARARDPLLSQIPVIVNTSRILSDKDQSRLTSATAILSKDRVDVSRAIADLKGALLKAGFDYQGSL